MLGLCNSFVHFRYVFWSRTAICGLCSRVRLAVLVAFLSHAFWHPAGQAKNLFRKTIEFLDQQESLILCINGRKRGNEGVSAYIIFRFRPQSLCKLSQEGGPIERLLSRPLRALAFDALEVHSSIFQNLART